MKQSNINKKYLTNKEIDNKADSKVDKKAHLKQLGLKQKIISSQAQADKGLNMVADKTRRFDIDKINN